MFEIKQVLLHRTSTDPILRSNASVPFDLDVFGGVGIRDIKEGDQSTSYTADFALESGQHQVISAMEISQPCVLTSSSAKR